MFDRVSVCESYRSHPGAFLFFGDVSSEESTLDKNTLMYPGRMIHVRLEASVLVLKCKRACFCSRASSRLLYRVSVSIRGFIPAAFL